MARYTSSSSAPQSSCLATILFFFVSLASSSLALHLQNNGNEALIPPILTTNPSSSPAGQTIGFQAHSYNDLDEWVQLLKKGARYIKIDPHYQPATFCKQQQRVNRTDTRGCFVLNHDTPSLERKDYNSSSDVLNMLISPLYKPWFTKQERIFIALCFKEAPDPCNTTNVPGRYWLSLVDDFFNEANQRVANQGLNLEFVLDGDAVPRDCFIQRWRPWVATSGPPAAYNSNNAALGYDRWQVLNPESDQFPADAKTHYGKFVNSSYSYQVWEPSSQGDILDVAAVYINEGLVHNPGLHYAINIDPAMFEVYSAPMTGKPFTWNDNIELQGSRPKTTAFENGQQQGSYSLATVFTFNGTVYYRINPITPSGLVNNKGTSKASSAKPLPFFNLIRNVESFTSLKVATTGSVFFLAADSFGQAILYAMPAKATDLVILGEFSLPEPNSSTTTAYSTASLVASECPTSSSKDKSGNKATTRCVVVAQAYAPKKFQPLNCGLFFRLWALHFDEEQQHAASLKNMVPVPIGNPVCLEVGVPAEAASIALTPSPTGIRGIVFYSLYGSIYGATVSVNAAGDVLVNNKRSTGIELPKAIEIDAGDYPATSILGLPSESGAAPRVMLLEAHGNGFCQNSEVHNKQPYPAACRQRAIPTENVLVYNYGLLQDWEAHILSGERMNACSRTIMHGAYDQGSRPSVALFAQQGQAQFGVTEVHEGFSSDEVDWGHCGRPLVRTGLVLDGWPLVQ